MSNFSPVDWSRAIVNKQYRPLNTVFNFQNRKSMNLACLIYIKLLIQIFLLSLCKGVPQWRYRLLKLLFILNLQMNISTFYTHHVTPHTLNELFHSALPWEYDVYVHSMRRSNCIVMNQHKHNTLTDVDTISVSSARDTTCSYSVYYQTHSHKQFTHTYPSSCWIPPSHSLNIFYFSQTQIQRICSFNETFKLHCNESTQAQYLNRRGYDLGLLSQGYNVFIQCVLSNTFTQAIHPHVSLELLDTTQPLAQYLLFFTNTNTFSHPPNFVLLCLNIYLSLPSYVLSSRKSTKWTSDLEPDLSINVMVLYTVQSPLFSRRSSRASATGTHPDWV